MTDMSKHIPSDIPENNIIKMSLEEMKDCVIKNANLFYNGEVTEVSDFVYDSMISLILKQDPTFDVYQYIKYKDGIRTYHDENIFRDFDKKADIANIDTEEKFNEYCKYYIPCPKWDGSSIVIYYDINGNLEKIISRGDDETGLLNTDKFRNMVPNKSTMRCAFAEVLVDVDNGSRARANGLVNSKFLQDDVEQLAHPIIWDYLGHNGIHQVDTTHKLNYKQFCQIRDTAKLTVTLNNKEYVFPCDGIVGYPIDNDNQTIDIHKLYYSEAKETTLTNIEWLVSENSGIIHPKANFPTVVLDDTNVSKASLYNYQYIIDNSIYKGMKIKVAKANLTIPKIIEFINPDENKSQNYINNVTCPHCGAKLIPYGEADCICSNVNCTWWYTFFYCKFFDTGFLTTEEETMLSETLPNDFEYIKKIITTDRIIKYFRTPENIVNYVAIPRINKANKAKLCDIYISLITDSDTTIESLLNRLKQASTMCLSDLMCEYVNVFSDRFVEYSRNFN